MGKSSKKQSGSFSSNEETDVITTSMPKLKRDDKQKSFMNPTWNTRSLAKQEAFVGGTVVIHENMGVGGI